MPQVDPAERLVGAKLSIVAPKPQTTRTSAQGVVTCRTRRSFSWIRGIHKSSTLLNRRMMDAVRAAADAPDVALFLIDAACAGFAGRFARGGSREKNRRAGDRGAQQDRQGLPKAQAAGSDRTLSRHARIRRLRSDLRAKRRRPRCAAFGDHRAASRRPSAIPGRLSDRSARALPRRRDRARKKFSASRNRKSRTPPP